MGKTISIAMTTFNGGMFLREQLESIYNQTKVPDEVVVCDDGSTDDTIAILEEYKETKGLKLYVNGVQLGVNQNFYKAISLCTGDYIALCDQDDVWLPKKLQITYDKMCELDGDYPVAVSSRCINVDEELHPLTEYRKIEDSSCYADTFIDITCSQGCSLMINMQLKNIVLSTQGQIGDRCMFDSYIAKVAAMRGVKYNIGDKLMLYRHHSRNVVAKVNSRLSFREHILVQGRFRGFLKDEQILDAVSTYIVHKQHIENSRINIFLSRLVQIKETKNKALCYAIVLRMPEFSFGKRLKIVLSTMVVDVLKCILK